MLVAGVGAGIQLLFTFAALLLVGSVGNFFLKRREGVVIEWIINLYVVGAIPGGFTSGWLYRKLAPGDSKFCVCNLLATALMFPLPLGVVLCSTSILERFTFIGLAAESTKALPFEQFIFLALKWGVFVLPFTIVSGLLGRNASTHPLIERPRIQR